MLGASNLRQQRRLWTLLERPDMIKKTNDERDADHEREIAVLAEIMLTRTADEWEEFLQARHVPAARVRTMGEALADPQLATRGVMHRHASGAGIEGGFGVPLAAFKFAHGGPRIDRRRRTLGQHNDEIFGELERTRAALSETVVQFALAPDFFTSADHLVSSRSMSAAYSSGVVGSGSAPSAAMRPCTSSDVERRAQRRVELVDDRARRAGRRHDAVMQHRLEAGQALPRPPSAARGISAERFGPVTAERAHLAVLDQPDGGRQRARNTSPHGRRAGR